MTIDDITSTAATSRTRRTALGLVLASLVLGSTLTACGSEADSTTCGELKASSTDEAIDLFKDAAKDDGGQDAKDAVTTVDAMDDTQRETFADALKATCDGQSDDTLLKDVDG